MRFLILISSLFLSLSLFPQVKKEYHDVQQTKVKTETDYYKGMPHGVHREYYKSGKLSRKGTYYYGKEDSTWTFYYEDGTKKAVERYERGLRSGTNQYYFKSGKLSQITKYQPGTRDNDIADSVWTSYYENGKVKSRESFVMGKRRRMGILL